MILPDNRYERIRHLVMAELGQAQRAMEAAAEQEDMLAFEAAQDDVDEWSLLIEELDAGAPEELRKQMEGA